MSVAAKISEFKSCIPKHISLIAVSKTQSIEKIMEAYASEHKIFGENKVQELVSKYEQLPKDIEWHLIGHLQTNKVKYIAPFVTLIHSVDSFKLLQEINKQAVKNNKIINCLLQIYIADEETKFGFSIQEAEHVLSSKEFKEMNNINISGLMGMATNTTNENKIRTEFKSLKKFHDKLNNNGYKLNVLSMGMSSDYKIAIEEGSNMIRVGSLLFGERNYSHN
jgi:pyridoxal phosphate enzyme (YggS family)